MRGGDGSENRGFQRRIVAVWGGEHRGDVALLACPVSLKACLPTTRGGRDRERRRKEDFSSKEERIGNDPSAGSPTETLLRLLLPLNDPV